MWHIVGSLKVRVFLLCLTLRAGIRFYSWALTPYLTHNKLINVIWNALNDKLYCWKIKIKNTNLALLFRSSFYLPSPFPHTSLLFSLWVTWTFFFFVLRNFKWLTEHLRILSSGHYPSLSSCAQQDYLDIGAKNGQITSGGPWNVTFPIAGFWNYTKHQGGVALPQRAHCSEKVFVLRLCKTALWNLLPSGSPALAWVMLRFGVCLQAPYKTRHSGILKYCKMLLFSVLVCISQHNDHCFGTKFSGFSKPLITTVANKLCLLVHGPVLGALCPPAPLILTKTLLVRYDCYLHFAEKQTEAQRIKEICSRSHSQ